MTPMLIHRTRPPARDLLAARRQPARSNSRRVRLGILALLCVAHPLSAQTPSLGAAQSFAVVGGQSVTVAGTGTTITGDVGVSPGTSITGIPAGGTVTPPFSTHTNDAAAIAAQSAVASLYSALAGAPGAVPLDAELGGLTVNPGTYSFESTANIAAGTTLTLSGAGTYIFQVGSAVTANVGSAVVLINGASACNVFWQVSTAATLNGATFAGTVVARTAVTLGVGARLDGRALTRRAAVVDLRKLAGDPGSVTMAGANVVGGCSGAAAGCAAITITPGTIADATLGVAYSQVLAGAGGAGSYAFDVAAGSLPSGLTLTSAGLLAGVPSTAGTSTFTIRATDANGCAATRTYTITVATPPVVCPVIVFTPDTFPGGTVGTAYSTTITGSAGVAPYAFDVQAGTLPPGLALASTGVVAGTPTTAGTVTVSIRATDANGCATTQSYTLAVAAAPPVPPGCPTLVLAPATLPGGTAGVAYTQTITGAGGIAPYSFGVTSGALPTGLLLTSAGVLSGTPATPGPAAFTVRGTASNGCFAAAVYTVTIAAAPAPPPVCPTITLAPASLPNGIVAAPYSQTIVASGGTAPYGFGVAAGILPTGVLLSATGVVSGTPTAAGQSNVTVRGTAANGCLAERAFSVSILNAVPALPQSLIVLLTAGLIGIGSVRLRARARAK